MAEGQAYQSAVKAAKAKYYSDIIESNCHKTIVLFNTINSVINPPNVIGPDISVETCENFKRFFISKIENIRSQIPPAVINPSVRLY